MFSGKIRRQYIVLTCHEKDANGWVELGHLPLTCTELLGLLTLERHRRRGLFSS